MENQDKSEVPSDEVPNTLGSSSGTLPTSDSLCTHKEFVSVIVVKLLSQNLGTFLPEYVCSHVCVKVKLLLSKPAKFIRSFQKLHENWRKFGRGGASSLPKPANGF